MNLLKRLRKITALLLVVFIVSDIGILNVSVLSAGGASSVDLLDPNFVTSHGGNIVSINADPNRSPFAVFAEAFGTDNPVEGATNFVREKRPTAERHVENFVDPSLGNVFKVEVHGNDCADGCYMHNTTYDSATDTFNGGNTDRQRIEIRPGDDNQNLIGLENDVTAYNWKLKIDKDIPKPDGFFHIFQYKAVNSFGDAIRTSPLHDNVNFPNFASDEDGNPILTLTVSSSSLDFRWAGIGSDAGMETLASVPLGSVKDKWVDVTVKILNSECGWVTMTMKDVVTGNVLMEYNDPNRVLDMWRRPELKYNGATFEGPYPAVSDMFNRPKWGIYRKADKSNTSLKGAKIYLSDITLYKSAVNASPVNLAYGKKAYNTGTASSNILQYKNAVPERLTDGVQIDPVIYPVTGLTATEDNYSALGSMCWIGTESSKKGNVIIDLGEEMNFNQVKIFAKSLRLKYVNVYISDTTATYSEKADLDNIVFTPVDPLYTDTSAGKELTYFNSDFKSDDTADKEYLIDLGKTYSSRYIKFYFENGSGSANATTMSGPPRISELEIYNAPQTPKNIAVSYTGGSEATISWDSVPADYFTIYDGGKVLVDNLPSNSYKLTNLDPGAVYNLAVRTVYTDPYSFKSMFSAEGKAAPFTTDGDPIIPNPPAAVTVTAVMDKSIDIMWDALPNAQSYKVTLVTDASERIVANELVDTSYKINDLAPGTAYTVKVYSIRRGTPSVSAAESTVVTTGIKDASDNLLFNKEVQYSRVWSDNTSSYGAHKALDNDVSDGSRWVALKGSTTAWMMVDIGEVTPVNVLEYYSYQNKLKKVSFYYATDGEVFTDPNSDKWIKILTDDRVAQGKYGNPSITKIAESIPLTAPVNARYIKFTIDEVDGDINVNEVKAFGPISFVGDSALTAVDKTDTSIELSWTGSNTSMPAVSYEVYNGNTKLTTVAADVYNYRAAGLMPNTEYTFRVKAVSESVYGSVYSTHGGLTLKVATLPDTQAPTWGTAALTASEVATTEATLTWSAAADNVGVTGYRISYGDVTLDVEGNVYSYRVTGLTSDTSYTFTVQARDEAGNWSTNGPTVTVTTLSVLADPTDPDSGTSDDDEIPSGTGNNGNNNNNSSVPAPANDTVLKVDIKTLDNLLSQAKEDSDGTRKIEIEIPKVNGATSYTAVLPARVLTAEAVTQKVDIKSELGTITVPGNMLSNTNLGTAEEVAVTIAAADKAKLSDPVKTNIGDRPIIELNVTVNGNKVEYNNPNAPVTVAIPYIPTADEMKNPEYIVVWYINSTGTAIPVPNGRYDAASGKVVFTTTHFSKFGVAYVVKTFDDIAEYDWAKKQIEVLASKGIINGKSEKAYDPNAQITRADFTILLVKTLGLTAKVDGNFSDVKPSDYYYNEVGIAKVLGIVKGQAENQFNPGEILSRQDMMTIAARAMSLADKLKVSADVSDLNKFADKESVAGYAVESVAKLVKEGLIEGNGGNINPKGNATRAEVAVFVYRIYNK